MAPYHGVLAQLGERFVRNEEAAGSSPVSSTTYRQAHDMDKSPSTALKRGLPRGYVGNLLTTEHPARSARVPPAAVVQWSVHLLAKQEIRVRFPPVAPKGIESRLRDPLCETRAMGRPADGAIRPAGLLFFFIFISRRAEDRRPTAMMEKCGRRSLRGVLQPPKATGKKTRKERKVL